jgi:peptidoglycan hydrolase-like protein with peptidoglycan-binding domain
MEKNGVYMIRNSVGKKGVNKKSDVQLVQEALNRSVTQPQQLLKIDGIVGLLTIAAIERFQKNIVGMPKPDGLVDVDGKTWPKMVRYLVDSPPQKTRDFQLFPAPQKSEATPTVLNHSKKIAWGNKVTGAFKDKVIQVCVHLDTSPDYLMSCMAFETGGTFSPSIKNTAGSGAVGLIQFMPKTAKALGTTSEKLEKMSAVEQLDYVKKYLNLYRSKLKKLEDVYMAILYPAAIGKPLTHTLFEDGNKTYTQNKGFDVNKDKKVSLKEISSKVRAMYEKGLTKGYLG